MLVEMTARAPVEAGPTSSGDSSRSRFFSLKASKPSRRGSTWTRTWELLGDRPLKAGALALTSIASGFSQSAILALIAEAAATIVAGRHHVSAHLGPIFYNASLSTVLLVALVLSCVQIALQVVIAYLPALISVDVQNHLRNALFESYTNASWARQSRSAEGRLQDLLSYQAMQAGQAVLYAANLVTAAVTFGALVCSALIVNVPVALIVMVTAAILFLALRPLTFLQRKHSNSLTHAQLEYASGVSEAVRLTEETQVFGVAQQIRERIGGLTKSTSRLFFRSTLLARMVQNVYQGLIILLLVGGLLGLYAIGGTRVASLGALVLMLVRASMYSQQVQGGVHGLHQTLPYLDRVEEQIADFTDEPAINGFAELAEVRSVALEDVSFSYQHVRVLHNLTFSVKRGELVSIVGPSGAGKSTLVRILLRLYLPAEGRYLVNSRPVEDYSQSSWSKRVAYLPQEPRLMSGTISDNIRYYRQITEREIERSARLAHIHDDIVSLPEGYDTVIGPGAKSLSLGQAQRLCLARTLAGQPDLVVLDEPTSALDPRSGSLIQQTLQELRGSVTCVVVAHRLAILDVSDRVIVLVAGRVQDCCTPSEAMQRNPFVRQALELGEQIPVQLT